MMEYLPQIIATVLTFALTFALRFITKRLIKRFREINAIVEIRSDHIIRICYSLINITGFMALVVIWGFNTRNLLVALSSVFAIVGVALFAQWSILSNITAGIILFFTAPYRIGDYIEILDKDMNLEVRVEDIFTFYTHLRTKDGGLHIIPNSLMLQKAIYVFKENEREDDKFPLFKKHLTSAENEKS